VYEINLNLSRFIVLLKVEQINVNLFLDTAYKGNQIKVWMNEKVVNGVGDKTTKLGQYWIYQS